jgi:hypothetical protein
MRSTPATTYHCEDHTVTVKISFTMPPMNHITASFSDDP